MCTGKKTIIPILIPIVQVILVILMVSSAGCIKMAQNALGSEKAGNTDNSEVSTGVPAGSLAIEPQNASTPLAVEVPSPTITDSVTEFSPRPTPDPYVIQHGARINGTPLDYLSFLNRQPEFTKTYMMNGYPVGLLVNVTQGPLYVVFTVNPAYDCLKDPDSCRGSVTVPVSRPSMTITVRNNQTNGVVAEDGYGGEFSSDTGTYNNGCSSDQSTVSNSNSNAPNDNVCQQPGPRYITVYGSGQYQIILDGSYLDVTISIITGTSPAPVTTPVTAGDDDS
ncbi:MAG: hypothetical protein WAK75_03925 [Methanoregula sp.]|uniref:hypothetical protein n=1 Tax=Methanoregula sp. TaxID=2052170 RepID=UPI003BB0E81B